MDSSIDRARLASGCVWLIRGMAVTAIGLPLALLDGLAQQSSAAFGPLGAIAVLVGIRQVTAATPRTAWTRSLQLLAVLNVAARTAAEAATIMRRDIAADAAADVVVTYPAWTAGAQLLALVVTVAGIVSLARHLFAVLEGVAADRWRQVTFGWVGTLVIVPLAFVAGALELYLVAASVAIIAAALLLLTLLATHRAAEDDTLGADFHRR